MTHQVLPRAEYHASLPTKRSASGVLLFNQVGELFLVQPTYKPKWQLVGGVIDKFESPQQAAIREIKEEIGLDINQQLTLRLIDHCYRPIEKNESYQFIFSGGILNEAQVAAIKLAPEELKAYMFVKVENLESYISNHSFERISKALEALKNNTCYYHENQALLRE